MEKYKAYGQENLVSVITGLFCFAIQKLLSKIWRRIQSLNKNIVRLKSFWMRYAQISNNFFQVFFYGSSMQEKCPPPRALPYTESCKLRIVLNQAFAANQGNLHLFIERK